MFTTAHTRFENAKFLAVLLIFPLLFVGCDNDTDAVSDLPVSEGYVEVEGGKVWYKTVGSGDATPLLLIHGGPGASSSSLENMQELANDRPVIFYDQLGSDRSDHPDDNTLWTVERFTAEVNGVRSALGLEEVYIYGHSWGATLALEAYLAKSEGVRALVLANPFIGTPSWTEDAKFLLSEMPADTRDAIQRHEAAGTTDTEEYQRAMLEYQLRHVCRNKVMLDQMFSEPGAFNSVVFGHMVEGSEWNLTGGALLDYDGEPKLDQIRVPTLFIGGRFDQARPETLARFHAKVRRSELAIIENASHEILLERPSEHNRLVRDFLAKTDAVVSAQ